MGANSNYFNFSINNSKVKIDSKNLVNKGDIKFNDVAQQRFKPIFKKIDNGDGVISENELKRLTDAILQFSNNGNIDETGIQKALKSLGIKADATTVFLFLNQIQILRPLGNNQIPKTDKNVPTISPAPPPTVSSAAVVEEPTANRNLADKGIPQVIPRYEITNITNRNNPNFKDKKGVFIDGKYYDFDAKGRVSRVYVNKPEKSVNDTENSFIYITYNDDDTVAQYYKFENEGEISADGTRTCGIYNADGTLEAYYVDTDFDPVSGDLGTKILYDKDGNITLKVKLTFDSNGKIKTTNVIELNPKAGPKAEELHSKLNSLTPENLSDILTSIEELNINDEYGKGILDVMTYYEAEYGVSLLEALSQTPQGEITVKTLMESVKSYCGEYETEDGDTMYKYTADIEKDMASHPQDYKKLSIDLKRMLDRGWLLKSENDTGEYGDNNIDINGMIDQNVKQKGTGDCYLIASVIELSQKPAGAKAIKEMITKNPDGSVTITFKGVNKSYTISQQEIAEADNFSAGDDDMRAIEIAFDKYRRDLAYDSDCMTDFNAEGGHFSDVTKAIFGIDAETITDNSFDTDDFNNENVAYTFDINIDGTYNDSNIKVMNAATGEEASASGVLIQNHEYSIIKSDNEYVYFVNPWDRNELLKLDINKFKALSGLSVSRLDLSKVA